MRSIQILLLTLITGFTVLSCSDNNDERECRAQEIAYINEVDAPATAKVGETVAIDVTFSMTNTCGEFSRFVETSDEQGLIIRVEADYKGCICGHTIIEDTQSYEFSPQSAGIYELNFRSSPSEFITVNIEVTE